MRAVLREGVCDEHARFRFVVMNGSRVCCAADDPANMCAACADVARREGSLQQRFERARAGEDEIPPPPDLGERIRAVRAAEATGRRPAPRLQPNGVPVAPDIGERIRERRAAGKP
jgi:hypothetical protein